ncbi:MULTISPECIES: hypothetical protein [Pandoraea]|uniref:hypothetical protein n=1 Tax=Pandoraea TaxID=93217 RepID=UPI001F5C6B5C|nr:MULTISPECIES: hypothetical protein [Pandoraea]
MNKAQAMMSGMMTARDTMGGRRLAQRLGFSHDLSACFNRQGDVDRCFAANRGSVGLHGRPDIRSVRLPAIRRSGDPAIRRSGDPAIRRSGDPAIRRSGDQANRRPGDQTIRSPASMR